MSIEQKQPAGVGPVERHVRPRAWAWTDEPSGEEVLSGWNNPRPELNSEPLYDQAAIDSKVAEERERIKAAVLRCTLFAEDCEGDAPEVDTARKALACTILAAIAGYEAPPPVGTPGSLFGA
jgi:hypothetical protein